MTHSKIQPVSVVSISGSVLIYGPPGVGKTWLIGSAPKPILVLDAESGIRTLQGVPGVFTWAIDSFADAVEAGKYLRANPKEFKSVAVDTLNELQAKIQEDVQGTKPKPSIQDYGEIKDKTERIVRAFRDLPVHFIATCHEAIERDEEGAVVKRRPMMVGSIKENLGRFFDIVGMLQMKEQKDASGEMELVRKLIVQAGPTWEAKDRTGTYQLFAPLDLTEMLSKALAFNVDEELDAPTGFPAPEQIDIPGHPIASVKDDDWPWQCSCGEGFKTEAAAKHHAMMGGQK